MFKVTAKSHYACVAMVCLAKFHKSDAPISAAEMEQRYQIPHRFLVQIMAELRDAGLVKSIRGARGGYRLTKSPAQISLLDVLSVVSEVVMLPECDDCPTSLSGVLGDKYGAVASRMTRQLETATLSKLARGAS